MSGTQSMVSKLQHQIEGIGAELQILDGELKEALSRAQMQREANVTSLSGEITKLQGQIGEQIDQLGNDFLTKADVLPQQALENLNKIRKKYDQINNKLRDYQENEDVLEIEHAAIPEVEIFETKFEHRHKLWNNRDVFE